MSWDDCIAIAPTAVGTLIALLAIIETLVEPMTWKGKAAWISIFVFLSIAGFWFTLAQQRLASASAKNDHDRLEAFEKGLNTRQDALNNLQQKMISQQSDLSDQARSISRQLGELKPPSAGQPDVQLRFVGKNMPAPLLVNSSETVARNLKWWVELWNLDRPPSPTSPWNPLLIPIAIFDYVRPHEAGGPENIFNTPLVAPNIKAGNRLFGIGCVTCPECVKSRCVWTYIVYNQGGWYAPYRDDQNVTVDRMFKTIPQIASNPDAFLNTVAPPSDRIAIVDLP
jgi:hypothetical protein